MSKSKSLVVIICVILMLTVNTFAVSLEKRHQLELNLGMWNQTSTNRTEVGIGGVATSVGANGFVGGISYGHWLSEGIALNISIDAMLIEMNTDAGIFGVVTDNSYVNMIRMGVKLYFPSSTFNGTVRPYAKISAGPYIGSQNSTVVGLNVTIENRTESALGGLLGFGTDFILGNHFMAGVCLGYNLMTDFSQPIGGSINYSGPEFHFGFSYLFGSNQ